MANQLTGASEVMQGKNAILDLITSEQTEQPTDEVVQEEERDPRILKIQQGDREVELQVLTEDVDAESLRLGYLAESDYRKKTMDLAEKRKAADAQLGALEGALEDMRTHLAVDLDALEKDQELKESDPQEYLERLDHIQKRAERYQAAKQQAEASRQTEQETRRNREQEALKNALPTWLDEGIMKEDLTAIGKQLTDIGFTPDEIDGLSDHRLFLLARKAAHYDALESVKDKRDLTPPRNIRPGTTSTNADRITEREAGLRKRLAESGKMRDAAALVKDILTR